MVHQPSVRLLPRLLCSAILIGCVSSPVAAAPADSAQASAKNPGETDVGTGEATFLLVKDSGFGGLMVAQGTDFSRFRNVQLFPAETSTLEVSAKGNRDAARSWQRASDQEIERIGAFMDEMVTEVFGEDESLTLVSESGDNTLAVQVRLMEFFPMMTRPEDAYKGTIGSSQGRGNLGLLKLQAVLVDTQARQMVGVIEDVIVLDAQHAKRNTRDNQARIWRTSFKQWLTKLEGTLSKLQATGQLAKSS